MCNCGCWTVCTPDKVVVATIISWKNELRCSSVVDAGGDDQHRHGEKSKKERKGKIEQREEREKGSKGEKGERVKWTMREMKKGRKNKK